MSRETAKCSKYNGTFQWRMQDFPEVGAQTSGGGQHTILPNVPRKLHEIERIWTPKGRASLALP